MENRRQGSAGIQATRAPPHHCPWELGSACPTCVPDPWGLGPGQRSCGFRPLCFGVVPKQISQTYIFSWRISLISHERQYILTLLFTEIIYFSAVIFLFYIHMQFLLLLWSRPCSIKFRPCSIKFSVKDSQSIYRKLLLFTISKKSQFLQVKLSNYQKAYRVENNSKTKICFPNQLNFSKNFIPFVFLEFIVAIFTIKISTY